MHLVHAHGRGAMLLKLAGGPYYGGVVWENRVFRSCARLASPGQRLGLQDVLRHVFLEALASRRCSSEYVFIHSLFILLCISVDLIRSPERLA